MDRSLTEETVASDYNRYSSHKVFSRLHRIGCKMGDANQEPVAIVGVSKRLRMLPSMMLPSIKGFNNGDACDLSSHDDRDRQ